MSEIQFFTKGENYMNYTNTGFLETDIEFAKDLEKALQEHEIHFSEYDALNGKTATFSLDDVEGFIGKDLEEIAATFYEEKMSLKGQIDFYGDENGRYAIHNSPLHSYTQDEAILMNATVSELLEELNRRNSEIFLLESRKDGQQIHGQFFESYEEAYREMEKTYNMHFNLEFPDFCIGKQSAYIQTFQYRLEWSITPHTSFEKE